MTKAITATRIAVPLPARPPTRQPTVALALGGGGARGLAHILMLEAFEELGVRPTVIAGTSIGAIYGAAFASGLSAAHIRAHTEATLGQRVDLVRQLFSARAEPILKLFNLLPVRSALLNADTLLDLMLPARVARDYESLAIPLAVVATDFYAQEQVVFTKGPLRQAVAASMALPAVFQPVMWQGRALVDGGLVNPLPFDIIADQADLTVAIDVAGAPRAERADAQPTAFETLFAAAQILQGSIVREKLKVRQPDVYIDVDVDAFHVLEFYRIKEILAAAQPAKERLKLQLGRLLGSVTVEALPVLPAPPAEAPPPRAGPIKAIRNRLAKKKGRKR